MKILVTPTSLQPGKNEKALDILRDFTTDLVFNPTGRPLTEQQLIPLLQDCDGYIAGLDEITEKVIVSSPKLKVISRYGAGYDRVDLQAASQNGITVTNTPGVNAEAVGELTFGLILSIARNIPFLNSQTRSGNWIRSTGVELRGKRLGILGLGAIGKVVARCAQGFDMEILAYDPYIDTAYCTAHEITPVSLEELYQTSQVISLHLPLTSSTRHLVNQKAFELMQEGTILVNASRGGIIDEDAAFQALQSGKLGGLGLDAFETEPPVYSPLFELHNVVVTPHTGAHTREATEHMAEAAIKNAIDILSGKRCLNVVNKV